MRRRVSALIIKDKKLLLVAEDNTWYWTPGGRIEEGETKEDTLRREIREELGAEVKSLSFYNSYYYNEEDTANFRAPAGEETNYLVELDGEFKISAEIKVFVWATAEEILKMPILNCVKENVINSLVKKGLL